MEFSELFKHSRGNVSYHSTTTTTNVSNDNVSNGPTRLLNSQENRVFVRNMSVEERFQVEYLHSCSDKKKKKTETAKPSKPSMNWPSRFRNFEQA